MQSKEQKRQWKLNNPDKVKAESARYRAKHKEVIKERDKQYYLNNAEVIREKNLKKYHESKHVKVNLEKKMLKRAKDRARIKGIDFNITLKDVVITPYCPILGIPLFTSPKIFCDNSPSLDRINPNKGYISGNVIVMSYRANTIKSYGTADEHMRIANFMRSYGYDI